MTKEFIKKFLATDYIKELKIKTSAQAMFIPKKNRTLWIVIDY